MTVRPVRPEEYDALAALTVSAYQALLGPDLDPGYVAELADVAGRAAVVDVLVAVDHEGGLEGGIAYIPGPGPLAWFDGLDEAGMRMLAVAPAVQGRGVGARLIAACVERAQAAGKASLLLHTTAPMMVAHRLYERAGFRRDPDRDEVLEGGLLLLAYVLHLDGRVGDTRPGGGIG
ncbi:MAG: GNAT family N-acetyltransferase [Actinomycetota bacterium]|nr:GNAT family N-acetyltransferase [Actinomycetota bacterium]